MDQTMKPHANQAWRPEFSPKSPHGRKRIGSLKSSSDLYKQCDVKVILHTVCDVYIQAHAHTHTYFVKVILHIVCDVYIQAHTHTILKCKIVLKREALEGVNYKRIQSGRQFFMETMLPFIAQQKSTVSTVFLTLCGLEGPHSHRSHQEVPHSISTSNFTMVAMALVLGHRGIRWKEESNKNKHNKLGVTGRHEEIKVCLHCKCNPHDLVDLKMPRDGFH